MKVRFAVAMARDPSLSLSLSLSPSPSPSQGNARASATRVRMIITKLITCRVSHLDGVALEGHFGKQKGIQEDPEAPHVNLGAFVQLPIQDCGATVQFSTTGEVECILAWRQHACQTKVCNSRPAPVHLVSYI